MTPPQMRRRTDPRLPRMRAAQISILFRNVALGVVASSLAAFILAVGLIRLDVTPFDRGIPWSLAVALGAACHLALKWRYDRAPLASRTTNWQVWAGLFCATCLAEGVTWGWASIALVGPGQFDLQLLVMLACYAMAAGSIPIFGSYLPAFWAMFLPTSLPFAVAILIDGGASQRLTGILALFYVAGMACLGLRAHGELKTILRLGFEKDELTERLVQEKSRAEEASLAKSRFLAAASHDLRQPVHALSLFVGALRASEMGAQARTMVGHIEASVVALDGLFGALLNISQLDANIVPNHPRPFRLQPLLERICREHADEAAAKGVVLRLHPCSLSVNADPALLERILRNLVSNAVRYTERGRVAVGCRRGDTVRIEVWDTGPGIAPALQNLVFAEFFQIGNPERDRAQGLGLGLAIVRRLVLMMDAKLIFRSVPGHGSVFGVAVPRAADGISLDTPAAPLAAMPEGSGLILVVDDEAPIRIAMQSLLTGWGYAVITAGSLAEMLARIADCAVRPVLLICDYRLPGGDNGLALINRLREEFNDEVPAMLITGDTAPERLLEARRSGLQLLHKPVTERALRDAVLRLAASPTAAISLAAPG